MKLALLIAVLLAVGGTDVARASTPENGGVGTILVSGNAGWAIPSLGPDYLAMRLPRGTAVRVCGRVSKVCQVLTVNDFGPSAAIVPDRVADIALGRWTQICQLPASAGLCAVTIETFELPATDAVQ